MTAAVPGVHSWFRKPSATLLRSCLAVVAVGFAMVAAAAPQVAHAAGSTLTRNPYPTDVTGSSALINFATNQSSPSPVVTYGAAGGGSPCTGSSATSPSPIAFTASTSEFQFKAALTGLASDTAYCYRLTQGGVDLLGGSPSPTFFSRRIGDSTPFDFAVVGDFGAGTTDEANVFQQIHNANPRFLVTVGDNAYNSGTQSDYGDLSGGNVFPPSYVPRLGGGVPIFAAEGNHGFTQFHAYLDNFPQPTVASCTGCRYQGDSYPAINGIGAGTYPSAWYAFDFGNARFYVLEVSWADGNGAYQGDYEEHWNPANNPAEYNWLKSDLAAHAATPIKFAFFHYPLYADGGGQSSDTYLQGSGTNKLEGLLASGGVDVVFNGHAHIYERNKPVTAGSQMVSYVSGGGGDALGSTSGCSSFDAYAIGSGSSCNAPTPTSDTHVHNFLKVHVSGATVTVTPTDETGLAFDTKQYTFASATGSIKGTVTDSSSHLPLSGATVSCSCGNATTIADGTYTIGNVPTGTYSLTASATNYTAQSVANVTVSANTATTQNFALGTARGSISGTVSDASTNSPIAGASVSCACGNVTTDANGRYSYPSLAPGGYNLSVSASGYGSQNASVTVSAGAATTKNFQMTALPGSITGTVSDAVTHLGVGGATVSCTCGNATTVADGSYTIGNVTPGTYSLTASATDYTAQSVGNVTVSRNAATTQNFALALAPGSIIGTVSDTVTDSPIAGASVSCTCGNVTTDANGHYSYPSLAPGSYNLSASAAGYVPQDDAVTVNPGAATTQNFEMTALPGSIAGTISDSSTQNPVQGASVSCTCGNLSSNASGRYNYTGVAPGPYSLTVSAAGYISQTVQVTVTSGNSSTQDFQLAVVPPGSITGTVTDAASHGPISGATVVCSCGSNVVTGADGSYIISGVSPGTPAVSTSAAGYTTLAAMAVSVSSGQGTTQDFALTVAPGSISGTITDAATHSGVAGATVSDGVDAAVTTASDGSYSIAGVAPGPYSLSVTADGYISQATAANVTAGAATAQDFALTVAPGSITGTVTDGTTHSAIPGATVDDGVDAPVTTANDGSYTIPSVAPGGYALSVTATGYGSKSAQVTVASRAATHNFALTLTPGSIGGTVTDATGNPVPGASVSDGVDPAVTSAGDGSYSIAGVAPGPYGLSVTSAGYFSQTLPVTVTGGNSSTQDFALVLVPPGSITGTVTDAATQNPIPNATVVCTCNGNVSVSTGADGTYSIDSVARGTYATSASAAGYTTLAAMSVSVSSGQGTTQDFALTVAPGSISGTITDAATHNPISGAGVSCACGNVSSVANGGYGYPSLAPGGYTLNVSAPGYVPQSVSVTVNAGAATAQSFALAVAPGTISGTVTDTATHTGIAGATVSDGIDPAVTTAANGSYTIAGVAPGSYSVSASAASYATQSIANVVVSPNGAASRNFALTASPGSISGTVSDTATHAGIAGATVSDGVDAPVTTNAGGVYTIAGVAPAAYTVSASAAGYGSAQISATVGAGQALQGVNLSLARPAGAQLVQSGSSSAATVTFPVASTAGHLLVLSASLYTGTSQLISRVSDGKNTWTKVGAYAVSGQYSDGELWYAANAAPVSSITVTTGASSVSLKVMEFSGVATSSPLEVATGKAATSTVPSSGSVTPASANDLVIGFIAGHSSAQAITVTASGYTLQSQQTSGGSVASLVTGYKVLGAASAQTFTGSFSTSMYWAAGIAAFKTGAPTRGSIAGSVTDASTHNGIGGATVSDGVDPAVTTAADGSYTIANVAVGTYTVSASASGHTTLAAGSVAVSAGAATTQNFALALAPPGNIAGTVTDSVTHNPIAGATVVCSCGSSVSTAGDGTYGFALVAPGSYNLTVTAAGYASKSAQVTVVSASPATQNFALVPPGSISGTVSDTATHAGIAGATVSDGVDAPVTTNAGGVYTIAGVAPAAYTVSASAAGYGSAQISATVGAGQALQGVNLSLARPAGAQLVQSGSSSAATVTFPVASTAGHLLVLSASLYTGTSQLISRVSDGKNTWTKVGAYAVSGQYSDGELWYAANAAPVSSITVTTGASSVSLKVMEFSGVATSSPLEVATGKAATSTVPSSGSVTPASANDLVIGFIAGHSSAQAITVTASGYTLQSQQTSGGSVASLVTGYKVLGAASAQTFTGSFSTSMYWAAGIAAFRTGS